MPYDDPDATDPMTFHAVEVETDDPDSMRDMAECFVEEYARLGLSAESILDLFRGAQFAGPAMAYKRLGEPDIVRIIEAQIQIRGPRALRRRVDVDPTGAIVLPVLE